MSSENRQTFELRLGGFDTHSRNLIMFAYDISKEAHRGQIRDGGGRYFEHPRNVALILIDKCEIKDPSMICAALLHDVGEDTSIFGNPIIDNYSKWIQTAEFRLSRTFDPEVAVMVIALSKPKVDGVEILSEEQAKEEYFKNLAQASPETLLVKMADRLHNLRTLSQTPPEKQARIIQETQEIYFALFNRVLEKFPKKGLYLQRQMVLAIEDRQHHG